MTNIHWLYTAVRYNLKFYLKKKFIKIDNARNSFKKTLEKTAIIPKWNNKANIFVSILNIKWNCMMHENQIIQLKHNICNSIWNLNKYLIKSI